jgi:hypothetical protein
MRKCKLVLLILCLCSLGGVAGGGRLWADDDGVRYAGVLRNVAPAVVTVMVVTKTTMQSGGRSADHESRYEIPGVVVDASGLIMTSIVPFSPERMLKMLAHADDGDMPQIKTTASEIKVLFEQDQKESAAFLAATDSNLGLAFIQLERRRDASSAWSISPIRGARRSATPSSPSPVSARVSTPRRTSPPRALSGEVTRPRKAWVIDRMIMTLGLPVFSLAGNVLGVLSLVDSGLAEAPGSGTFDLGMEALAGAAPAFQPFLIPATAVAPVVDQAREQAAHKAAERAAAPPAAAPPATPGAPQTSPPAPPPAPKSPPAHPGS